MQTGSIITHQSQPRSLIEARLGLYSSSLATKVTLVLLPPRKPPVGRAGLTIWWALRTPQRRVPTRKLDAEEGEKVGEVCPLPKQLGIWGALHKLLSGVRGGASAVNGFGEI